VFIVLFLLAVALITVIGAELSRSSCRRMLTPPAPAEPTAQLVGVE